MLSPYRPRNLAQLADKLHCSFQTEDELDLVSQLQDFRLFSQGRDRRAENVLRHHDGLLEFDMSIFDYSYAGWGKGKDPHKRSWQTVFFVQSKALSLPELELKPETLGHKLAGLLGYEDIDFVRFPKFSGQYHLTGPDEEYIRHHFNDGVLQYFTEHKGWTVEGLGFYLVFYRKGRLVPSAEIEAFYRRGINVFNLLSGTEHSPEAT